VDLIIDNHTLRVTYSSQPFASDHVHQVENAGVEFDLRVKVVARVLLKHPVSCFLSLSVDVQQHRLLRFFTLLFYRAAQLLKHHVFVILEEPVFEGNLGLSFHSRAHLVPLDVLGVPTLRDLASLLLLVELG